MKQRRIGLVVVALATLLGACSSSRIANMWKDPQYPQKPIDKMFVVGFRTDEGRRRFIEDSVVSELTRVKLTATASYREFPSALPDTQQVVDVVKRDGYNGVLVVIPLGTETRDTYVPGYVTAVPGPYYGGYGYGYSPYGYWGSYYYPAYQTIYQPGYVERDEVVRIRIDVWSTDRGGTLVWTGTTETVDPTSSEQIRREVTQLVLPELRKSGVIVNK